MQDKIESLKHTLSQHPPDAKLLQMQLQGGIATSVNQGPFYIAQSFLDIPPEQHTYHHRRLKVCFKEFTKRSAHHGMYGNTTHIHVVYCTAKIFHWTKIPHNPKAYPCIAEIFHAITFCPCSRDGHRQDKILG